MRRFNQKLCGTAVAMALITVGCGSDAPANGDDTTAPPVADTMEGSEADIDEEVPMGNGASDVQEDAVEVTPEDVTMPPATEDTQGDDVQEADIGDSAGHASDASPEGDSGGPPSGDVGPDPEADSEVDVPEPPSDMDGDGIPDADDPDMDGDGYSNDDEMHAGTDPMDASSVIYVGGWPYNQAKDEIADPGWDSEPLLGTVMPNYQALDQHGDLVSLYDFAKTGKPIVLDVVTWFCEPCKAMADYFSNGDPSVMDDFAFFADKYDIIRDLIVNGDIHWITIMWSASTPMEQADAALWEETWPSEFVTVLADTNLQLQEYLYVKAMPRIDVLDEHMTFVAFCDNDVPCDSEIGGGPGGPIAGLKWLESYYNSLYGAP